jgi:hypothetical protein
MTSRLYDVIVTSHGEKVTFADKPCTIGAYLLWNTVRNSYDPSPMAMTPLRSDVIVTSQSENSILTGKRCELRPYSYYGRVLGSHRLGVER